MQIVQLIFTALFILWLFVTAYLLYRHAISAGAYNRRLQQQITDLTAEIAAAAKKSADAAERASQAAIKMLERLLANK